jgi:hypothetical protein
VVTVKLPRAEWEALDALLEVLQKQGWLVKSLRNEINAQVDKQEN